MGMARNSKSPHKAQPTLKAHNSVQLASHGHLQSCPDLYSSCSLLGLPSTAQPPFLSTHILSCLPMCRHAHPRTSAHAPG